MPKRTLTNAKLDDRYQLDPTLAFEIIGPATKTSDGRARIPVRLLNAALQDAFCSQSNTYFEPKAEVIGEIIVPANSRAEFLGNVPETQAQLSKLQEKLNKHEGEPSVASRPSNQIKPGSAGPSTDEA